MKKKIISLGIVLVLCMSVLSGCSSFSKINVPDPQVGSEKTDYVVRSQGGNAVQYGNYVYFINGTRGYDDTDGKNNVWGNVVKGALYRVELSGDKVGREFYPEFREGTESEFFTEQLRVYKDGIDPVSEDDLEEMDELGERDEKSELIDVVKVDRIASKVIGTSGYKKGGIYIFDEYVYYATPNNEQNKQGTILSSRTDFMRTKLDGSKTQKLYTTPGDSADQPYAFYKSGNSVYLVCAYKNSDELTSVTSVKVTGNKKPERSVTITEKATSVLFSTKDYYDSKEEHIVSTDDFIFFTRGIEKDDGVASGNIVEMCLPSGNDSVQVLKTGQTVTLLEAKDGALYFKTTSINGDEVKMANFHGTLMERSSLYRESEAKLDTDKKRTDFYQNAISTGAIANYTEQYFLKSGIFSSVVNMIGVGSSGITFHSATGTTHNIVSGTVTYLFVDGEYLYFTESDIIYRVKYDRSNTSSDYEQVSHSAISTTATFRADYAAGYCIYFAQADEWADGYAFFRKIMPEITEKETLVYKRLDSEVRPSIYDETETPETPEEGGETTT